MKYSNHHRQIIFYNQANKRSYEGMNSSGTVNISLILFIQTSYEESVCFCFQSSGWITSVFIALSFLPACYHFLEIILSTKPKGKFILRHSDCLPTANSPKRNLWLYHLLSLILPHRRCLFPGRTQLDGSHIWTVWITASG